MEGNAWHLRATQVANAPQKLSLASIYDVRRETSKCAKTTVKKGSMWHLQRYEVNVVMRQMWLGWVRMIGWRVEGEECQQWVAATCEISMDA